MDSVFAKLEKCGVIPVIVIEDAKDAVPLAKALLEGGLPCAEVTFRTAAARDAIARIREEVPEVLLGGGTVLSCEMAEAAMNAGAQFLVSPGLNPEVVSFCIDRGYPITPGVVTPGEIEKALSFGLTNLKFFPAEPSGGLTMIKALSAVYRNVKFMPTGGISAQNLAAYLQNPAILACGGSWMAPKGLVAEGNFDAIREKAAEAAEIVRSVRG